MSIRKLFFIFFTWNIRLPYWLMATIMTIFVILLIALFVVWRKKLKFERLCTERNKKLVECQEEVLIITSKLRSKENECIVLNKKQTTVYEELQEKENAIKTLSENVLSLQVSVAECENQSKDYETERNNLLHDLHIREKNIAKLNKTLSSSTEKIQKLKTENVLLRKSLEDDHEFLNRKKDQFENLEESYNKVVNQNKILEDSKVLLEKEIDELKAYIKQQTNIYKTETRNLELKIGRRDKKLENMSKTLNEINKKLQTVQEEKSLIEDKLQNVQEEQRKKNLNMNKSLNIIEKLAKW